jgi:hypothetical protein
MLKINLKNTYIYAHIHTHIHTYTHIRTQTYIHIYIHTYKHDTDSPYHGSDAVSNISPRMPRFIPLSVRVGVQLVLEEVFLKVPGFPLSEPLYICCALFCFTVTYAVQF